ncbi:Golgi-associated RAB2 interactor protein 4 [Dasypus novemcinctus]|uniref:Golgi-associated RAB2 interactor protein 4 n=1 Tax=Dasypus novemcinctus TaxID=9361 RepID=UPI0026604CF1|nr:Golgi-associated RAB2 interactor protein 4 [Dasypus novemcinctus]
MGSGCLFPSYTAQSGSAMGMFSTAMGKLQRQLRGGEYDLFRYAPVFESDFIQVSKRGEVIDVHNRVRMVTVGIACTSPLLPLPDVMLLARPAPSCEDQGGRGQATKGRGRKAAKTLELTRLLPLKFVRISVHDREKQQLRLKFATGRSCYLQLCPPLDAKEDLFTLWEQLIYLLRPPVDSISSTHAVPAGDVPCVPGLEEEAGTRPADAACRGQGDQDQASIRSLHMDSEVSRASSSAYAGGEGVEYAPHKSTTTPDTAKPTPPAKGAAAGTMAVTAAKGAVAGAVSVADTEHSTAVAGAATKGPGDSTSRLAVAGVAYVPSKNIEVAVAGAASQTTERAASTGGATASSPESSLSVALAGAAAADQPGAGTAQDSAAGPPEDPKTQQEARKERREKRDRRDKDRALSRTSSRRHATAHSRRKAGSRKVGKKSSGGFFTSRRSPREEPKGKKGRGSRGSSRRSSAHRGYRRRPVAKESWASPRSGRSRSTVSSSSTSKRLSRISSFLRNLKASLSTKPAAQRRPRAVDIASKRVERSRETFLEAAECDQAMVIGARTSETVETVAFEAS